VYELGTHLECWVLPIHIVKSFNLRMSTGFWGARKKQATRVNRGGQAVAFPVPTVEDQTPLTDQDIEHIEEDLLNAGEQAGDLRARFGRNSEELISLRSLKLQKIEDYLVRVRIVTTPGMNILPKNEDYDVQCFGGYPESARIGALIDKKDPTGIKYAVPEQFGWTKEEYEQYLGSLKNIPQSDSTLMQQRIRSQQKLLRVKGTPHTSAVIPIAGSGPSWRDPLKGPGLELTYPGDHRIDDKMIQVNQNVLADYGLRPDQAVTVGIARDPAFRRANPNRINPVDGNAIGGVT